MPRAHDDNRMRLSRSFVGFCLVLTSCSHLPKPGLAIEPFTRQSREYFAVWIPFGLADYGWSGQDFLYFRREIPYSGILELDAGNALMQLLNGPSDEEQAKGAVRLVKPAGILGLTIKNGKAQANFTQEFAPAGGSLAVWQCQKAVGEVLRQFPEIEEAELLIEGVPAIESLQP